MLPEAHFHAALNYFYFLLLDEGAALHSALKVIKLVQKSERQNFTENSDRVLIANLSKVLIKARGRHWRPGSNPPKSDWKTPYPEVLGGWKEYMRHSKLEYAEALVLRYILNYPVDVISDGLDLPEGTVLFRLGRGLEHYAEGQKK